MNEPQKSDRTYIICNDCAFHIKKQETINCTHPEELDKNCITVRFCSSFEPSQEIDSPCVSFDFDK